MLAVGIISTAVYSQQGAGKDLPEITQRKGADTDRAPASAPAEPAGKNAPAPRVEKLDDAQESQIRLFGGQPSAATPLTGTSSAIEKPFSDPIKEQLRLANKVLQEEIEDEKDRLEALQKKLQRLRKSGLSVPEGDRELAMLRQQNRLLQQQLKNLQGEVRVVEEEVEPFKRALLKGAGPDLPDLIRKNRSVDKADDGPQKKF